MRDGPVRGVDVTPGGFTIEQSARRLGHYRWCSLELFRILGAWVPDVTDAEAKLAFAASSRHHGWHAEQIADRLPRVGDLRTELVTKPASAELSALFTEIAATGADLEDASARTVARFAAIYRIVVPSLASTLGWHLAQCSPLADASVARTLGFVHGDLLDDWTAAEVRLQQWSVVSSLASVARDVCRSLEPRWAETGGISGPDTWVAPTGVGSPSSS